MVQAELCKIALVIRTIGAERGRAARGRPRGNLFTLISFLA